MKFSHLLNLKNNLPNLKSIMEFVPHHKPVQENEIKMLEEFLMPRPNILVLTGAGISTESGIPDYRSEGVGLYARSNHKPIQHPDFVKYESVRLRYWTRNYVGWPTFSAKEPNSTHHALSRFEREGRILGIVTQNVDRLHGKAGSKNVIEIHGCGYDVICLSCDYRIDRHEFQNILNTLNPEFHFKAPTMMRPDGDVDIPQKEVDSFKIPPCPKCGGNLKPEIVFFGDNIPLERVERVSEMVCQSDGVLVLGSSLLVFSGYRIILQAKDLQLPVAIVNIGETRGDHLADIKISAKCGDIIPKLFNFM
ncbi:NAD-dependent protein deacylase Sirt4 [Condylostylus longicornis]|uniref:NAD-dependent protein deacylase Sirt4 n=1 Tax=Condylostylus longicornis TaxID=2530218 RepID=UPI00244DBC7E|nr:NAD-dependent protein deacylase Sirt4 [Condylostylus longicornis]